MTWVKRNLFFLIGSVVALGLIGLGGFYLWSERTSEISRAEEIEKVYGELTTLVGQKPQPGKPNSPDDNVLAAKNQTALVQEQAAKIKNHFQGIPPVAGRGGRFANQLDVTVAELHHAAEQAGVAVPKNYYFTFQAQQKLLEIPPASVGSLAMHLSEIKAICEILFDARINQLTYIQREVASPTDTNAQDYLPPGIKTVLTPQAVITPYAVSFDCFSGELAAVLGGLAASPHGFVVKTIEVEPAAPAVTGVVALPPGGAPGSGPFGGPPSFGGAPAGGPFGGAPGGVPPGAMGRPGMGRGAPGPAAPPPGAKPVTLVNENRLRVNLLIEVVKPKK